MSLIIDDPDIEALACLLAAMTGESVDEAVARAIQDRLDRTLPPEPHAPATLEELEEIVQTYNRRPLAKPRHAAAVRGTGTDREGPA